MTAHDEGFIPDGTMWLQPKNTLPRIEQLWAIVSVDAQDGNEGVCAAMIGGVIMPLIAADEKRLEQIVPIAKEVAAETGTKFKLVRFSNREEVSDI
jgi:hypothetical protein